MPVLTLKKGEKTTYIPFFRTMNLSALLCEKGFLRESPCGGQGRCGKCAVKIYGAVSEPDAAEIKAGTRLACRVVLNGDAFAEIPDASEIILFEKTTEDKQLSSVPWNCAMAVDIGTTNVEVRVFSKKDNSVNSIRFRNPQVAVASDVVGRINAALNGESELLKDQINSALYALVQQYKPDKAVITGNTAMLYLLCGISPQALAVSPFKAEELFGKWFDCGAKTYLAPCMSAFNGGDTSCAVLSSGMCDREETSLLCDIGTNGELALWKNGKLFVTSVAAGPAFEGAEISNGCAFRPDAIWKVSLKNGTIWGETSDELIPPVGICGSGLIDAMAVFLRQGYMDREGNITSDLTVPSKHGNVKITGDDIRAFQFAKSAIRSGIELLLQETDTSPDEINNFYLAGGFGTSLSVENAVAVGLFPKEFLSVTKFIGNAAFDGAMMLLFDERLTEKIKNIAASAIHIQLGGNENFNKAFIENLIFKEL